MTLSSPPAAPLSLADLVASRKLATDPACATLFEIDRVGAARLLFSEFGAGQAVATLRAPLDRIADQALVYTRDRVLGGETVFNEMRASRATIPTATPVVPAAHPCPWCDPDGWGGPGHSADDFGEVYDAATGTIARGNWARQAPVSGVVHGPCHDLAALVGDAVRFEALYAAAEEYIRRAEAAAPGGYYMVGFNGGVKSASSVEHVHLQVFGRHDRPFAYPARVRAWSPADYWARVRAAHEALGLAVGDGDCVGWVNLVPVKERDLTLCSPTLRAGAAFAHTLLAALAAAGTKNFTLAAHVAPPGAAFRGWPPVLWRFVDRGDPAVRHSDWGVMEMFGTSVVASDPFAVRRLLGA